MTVNENRTIELKKVYNPVTLVTNDGEMLSVCMRDTGFEFTYEGKKYFAKAGGVGRIQENVPLGNIEGTDIPVTRAVL